MRRRACVTGLASATAARMVHQSYLAGIPVVRTEGDTNTVDSLNEFLPGLAPQILFPIDADRGVAVSAGNLKRHNSRPAPFLEKHRRDRFKHECL